MEKRGQTTTIISIVSIIILVTISSYVAYNKIQTGSIAKTTQAISISQEPVFQFITECLKDTASSAILEISKKGGIYKKESFPKINFFAINEENELPYFYDKGINRLDNSDFKLEHLEQQISMHIKNNLPACINGFYAFKEEGYTIKYSIDDVTTTIEEGKTDIHLKLPLKLRKETYQTSFSDFKISVPSNLLLIYNTAQDITSSIAQEPGYIDLTYMAESELDIQRVEPESNEDIAIYILTDYSLDQPLQFIFAVRY